MTTYEYLKHFPYQLEIAGFLPNWYDVDICIRTSTFMQLKSLGLRCDVGTLSTKKSCPGNDNCILGTSGFCISKMTRILWIHLMVNDISTNLTTFDDLLEGEKRDILIFQAGTHGWRIPNVYT